MKEGWDIKRLGEIAEIEYGYTDKAVSIGDYRYIRITDIDKDGLLSNNEKVYINSNDEAKSFLLSNGDLLMARIGATFAKVLFYQGFEPSVFASYLIRIKFKHQVYNKFYWYFSKSTNYWEQAIELSSGAAQPQFNGNALKQILFTFPKSFSEQQRIVSILDQAFAAIDKAKANAEQNLKNTKELFESYLQGVFEKNGNGWEKQKFEDCFKLKSGDNLTAKNMSKNAIYPVFGGNGIAGYHNDFNLSGSNVIIGRVGALCGNVRHVNEKIWLTDNAFKVVDFQFNFDHSFLMYLLNYKNLRNYARQAAQPVISNTSLKDVTLNFPTSITEQQTIVKQLDTLLAETQKLEAIYQQKINNLEELKKSILDKAFKGEL